MGTRIDVEVVRAAQTGDEQALAVLVAESLPLVYGVVGKALRVVLMSMTWCRRPCCGSSGA